MLPEVIASVPGSGFVAAVRGRPALLTAAAVVAIMPVLSLVFAGFRHPVTWAIGALLALLLSALPISRTWTWWVRILAVFAIVAVVTLLFFLSPTYLGVDRNGP